MLRQRIRVERSTLVVAGQLVTVVLGLALVWYGIVLALLAAGVLGEGAADALTGYRSAYDSLAGLEADDVDGLARVFIGVGGLLAFLLFGWLALRQVPRPRLARGELLLSHDERGEVTLAPRAFERAVESAALGHGPVTEAVGRFGGDEVTVAIGVSRAVDLADTLRVVQRLVRDTLSRHELPPVEVHVIVTKYEPRGS